MSNAPYQDAAQTGARIESVWNQIKDLDVKHVIEDNDIDLVSDGPELLAGYTMLKNDQFHRTTTDGQSVFKAIALMDQDGNIHVHFNGTGDGNWCYNADSAYGEGSVLQEWAANFLDEVIRNNPDGKVYVTGHSQGGNNAAYAAMMSDHADRIEACISLDGPGMSRAVVEKMKETLGEEEYQRRLQKLYAYNGESDFVSTFGQEKIIPEDHTYIVSLENGYKADPEDGLPMAEYHICNFMLDDEGNFGTVKPYDSESGNDGESYFRRLLREIMDSFADGDQENQMDVARFAMDAVEKYKHDGIDSDNYPLTQEGLDAVKKSVAPLILYAIDHHPDWVAPLIQEFISRNDYRKDCPDYSNVVNLLVDALNKVPMSERQDSLQRILDCIYVDDKGEIKLDWDKTKKNVAPILADIVADNPVLLEKVVEELMRATNQDPGVTRAMGDLIYMIITAFGDLPREERVALMTEVFSFVTMDEEGNLKFDWKHFLLEFGEVHVAGDLMAMLIDIVQNHPWDLAAFLVSNSGLVAEFVKEHPLKFAALLLVTPIVFAGVILFTIDFAILSIINTLVKVIKTIWNDIVRVFKDTLREFVARGIDAISRFMGFINEWRNRVFNPGASYAANNPFFRIDTGEWFSLSARVDNVIRQLVILDGHLDSLYWTSGLLDVLDLLRVLRADLGIGSGTASSTRLNDIRFYLYRAAQLFEQADAQVRALFE